MVINLFVHLCGVLIGAKKVRKREARACAGRPARVFQNGHALMHRFSNAIPLLGFCRYNVK